MAFRAPIRRGGSRIHIDRIRFMKPTVIICGAGSRGTGYSEYIRRHPEEGQVVGVAEPRKLFRENLVQKHGIAPGHVFRRWQDLVKVPRFADAVIVSTPDRMHEKPMLALSELGYHILQEKPLAPSVKACERMVEAAKASGKVFAVCHVMRYTPYTQWVKRIVDSGVLGEIVHIDHTEPVGFWHQAHSFVRGNWHNTRRSSFMLLQKSCHDIDWLSYILGKRCLRVSSFGSLTHFRKESQPAGAAHRCMDCPFADTCLYSAKTYYFGMLERKAFFWPLDVVCPEFDAAALEKALREGPYGVCVYDNDNDVVDHQVCALEYEGGATVAFSMYAFNNGGGRKTRIGGTKGYLETDDSGTVRHFDYASRTWETVDTSKNTGTIADGHGGGDDGLMRAWLDAVAHNDQRRVWSGPEATLESHRTVFALEKARLSGKVVAVR